MAVILPYDRVSAAAYADYWATRRNPDFYDFSQIGGDCTSFASQCLLAGSGVMNYTPVTGWYYINANNRTPSWTGVQYLYRFLLTNTSAGPFASDTYLKNAEKGDIIQLMRNGIYYHSLVVSQTGDIPRVSNILVDAHSIDSYRRPLSSYSFDGLRLLHIEGVYDSDLL